MSRQEQNSGVTEVREAHRFDEARLAAWMESHVEGYRGPLKVEQFKGGQSNPTYRLTTPNARYVMRRKPPGVLLPSAHAVDREYRVISALYGAGFPVAKPFGLCTDPDVAGTMFYIMHNVEGRIFWDMRLPELSNSERPLYFDAMNATLAALHSLDPNAIGLSDYGKPGNYFQRQIGRWAKQYREDDAAGRLPALDETIEWLSANIPPGDESRVVHGDYRCDNMIFHSTEPRVVAVLDWELSTLGHPLADFSYHLMMYRVPPTIAAGLAGYDIPALNIPSEADYVAAYCRRTRRAGIPKLNFYLAFSLFRMAAIIHGIKGRLIRGTAASAHARDIVDNLEHMADLALGQTKV